MIPTDHQWKLGKYRKKLICCEKFTILRMLTNVSSVRCGSLGISEGLTTHCRWQTLPSLISNQEVFNDVGIKLLMTGSFEGPQVPIDFWLCTKMIVRVGMIQCFLFHVLTGGRLVYMFGKHTSRLIKRFLMVVLVSSKQLLIIVTTMSTKEGKSVVC